MRDIGLYIMAKNDADLLTDNLQALREISVLELIYF